jgi:hypothetical protein
MADAISRVTQVGRRVLDYKHRDPTLRTGPQTHEPTVFMVAADFAKPSGGVRVLYRHVDLLNQAGIPAAIVHRRPGFRCTWFENATVVHDARSVLVGPDDLVVTSELAIGAAARLPRGHRHVVFNQSGHLTWRPGNDLVDGVYVNNPALVGVVAVSEHSRQLLEFAFPGLRIDRIHNSIDSGIFYAGKEPRRRELTYLARRGRQEANQVLQLLRHRGALDGWTVTPLDGVSQNDLADKLRQTSIFLNFVYQEGFGLPAVEAMACGNYVIGFHGFGGREFLRPDFSAALEPGDVLAMAKAIERTLGHELREPGWCSSRGLQASEFVLKEYSAEREKEEVVTFYRALMGR